MPEIIKSNIKHHAHGVITWTVESGQWISVAIYERGWGNGYIAIPVEHPFMKHISEEIKPLWGDLKPSDGRMINVTYNQLNEHFPVEGQEWTYSTSETIEGKNYYVFGFDTLHSWNNLRNSGESQVIEWIEDYINVVNKDLPSDKTKIVIDDAERQRLTEQLFGKKEQ